MNRRYVSAALAAVWLLASCGGSSGSNTPPLGNAPISNAPGGIAPQGMASAKFVLSVPAKVAPAKKPGYVSPSTQSVGVSVAGGTATFTNITPTSPGCSGSTPTNPYNCTITITGTGTQSVAITTYDQPSGAGNKLSANAMSVTFTPGQTPSIPLVLNGVPASVALSSTSSTFFQNGTKGYFTLEGATQALLVTALDADNNIIVGPGSPTITVSPAPVAPASSTSASVTSPSATLPNAFSLTDSAYETVTLNVTATPLTGSGGTPVSASITLLSGALVSTFSGTAPSPSPLPGFTNGSATASQFNYPSGAAIANGTIYIADRNNCLIRGLVETGTTAGTSSTVAGAACNGTAGALYHPEGITFDSKNGDFYIADFAHCQIQQMTPAGALSVIAGNGTCGRTGISTPTTGAAAEFYYPDAITYDATADALFVSDALNCSIRQVSTVAPYNVTLAAGNANVCGANVYSSSSIYVSYSSSSSSSSSRTAKIVQPGGVAADGAGNLYITSTQTNVVEKIVESTGVVTIIAGRLGRTGEADGVGTSAEFDGPQGIVYAGGTLYVVDTRAGTIRAVNVTTGQVSTIAGNPLYPCCLSFPTLKHRKGRKGSPPRYRRDFISAVPFANGPGPQATFRQPTGIVYDAANNRLLVTDQQNDVIRQILL